MVERVIIDPEGTIRLELRTPFAYLRDISDTVRGSGVSFDPSTKARAASDKANGLSSGQCSDSVLSCWGGRIRTYEYRIQSPGPYRLATPQCAPDYSRPLAHQQGLNRRRGRAEPACARSIKVS